MFNAPWDALREGLVVRKMVMCETFAWEVGMTYYCTLEVQDKK